MDNERAAQIVDAMWRYFLGASQDATVAELAEIVGLSTGTVESALKELSERGFVVKHPERGQRCWQPSLKLKHGELVECARKGLSPDKFWNDKQREERKLRDTISKAPQAKAAAKVIGGDRPPIERRQLLEEEDFALARNLGIVDENEVIAKCFDNNYGIYRSFTADREQLRRQGENIPRLAVSEGEYKAMAQLKIAPVAYLITKFKEQWDKVEGLKAAPKVTEDTLKFYEANYGPQAAADLKRRIEEEEKRRQKGK